MRFVLSLCLMSLLLAACGGDATNSPGQIADSQPTAADFEEQLAAQNNPTEEVNDNSVVIVTPQAQVQQNTAPLPGTMVYDSEYETDNFDVVFDRVIFIRYGGQPDSPSYLLKLRQDGSYELNSDTLGQVNAQTVTNIDNMIKEVNFFAINTPMLGPSADNDHYRYTITVERAGEELTIRAEDGFIPQNFKRLIGLLMGVIVESSNTALVSPISGT